MKLRNPEVRIETTNLCNASCTICPREKMTRKKCTMDFLHFMGLVDEAKELGAELISLFGYGEPLLDPKLVDRVLYVKQQGMKTFITSNGSLLTTDLSSDLLLAGLDRIRFSVHGFGPDYNKVHRKLKYETVIRNISNFISMNKLRHGGSCRVDVSVIPMHGESVEKIREFWEDSVDGLEIWKPHNWTDGRKYRKVSKKKQEQKKKTCGRPEKGPVQINADGKMMVCCFDYDAKLTVGDTYFNSIEEILKSDSFNWVRDRHRTGDLSGMICETCDQLIDGPSPLLYSTVDPECKPGKTSSAKFCLEGE